MLSQLYLAGTTKADYQTLVHTANPHCRGRLGYQDGPEYVFEVDRTKEGCGTVVSNNATHVMYKNGLQGFLPISNQTYTKSVSVNVQREKLWPIVVD